MLTKILSTIKKLITKQSPVHDSLPETEKLQSFYDWLYSGPLIDKNDPVVVDDFQKKLISEMDCLITSIKAVSKEEILNYLKKIPVVRLISIIQLFRTLTTTSKVNFEIFFSNWLV